MKRLSQFASLVSTLFVVCLFCLPVSAQKGARKPSPPPENNKSATNNSNSPYNTNNNSAAQQNNKGNKQPGNGRQAFNVPPKFVEHLQDMSPEQQERFMANNERFRNMTPQRQAQIRRNLQHWNSLTPEQRIMLRQRQAAMAQMTPQELQYVNQQLKPLWQNMAPARRLVVLRHVRQLDGLTDSERDAKLRDPAFAQGLTPEEQEMIPFLHRLRVGTAPEPPPAPVDY